MTTEDVKREGFQKHHKSPLVETRTGGFSETESLCIEFKNYFPRINAVLGLKHGDIIRTHSSYPIVGSYDIRITDSGWYSIESGYDAKNALYGVLRGQLGFEVEYREPVKEDVADTKETNTSFEKVGEVEDNFDRNCIIKVCRDSCYDFDHQSLVLMEYLKKRSMAKDLTNGLHVRYEGDKKELPLIYYVEVQNNEK